MSTKISLKDRFLSIEIASIFDFLFYSLVLVAPIVVYGLSIGGMSLRLSRVVICLISPFVLLKITCRPSLIFRDKFFLYAIVPFTLFTSLSILWTSDSLVSFGENRLFSLYEVLFVYIIFMVADLSAKRFQVFIKYYLLSFIIPALIAFREIANNLFRYSRTQLPFVDFLIEGKYEAFKIRSNLLTDDVSRVASTLAEPTIFGCFASTVFLMSLAIEPKNKKSLITLKFFQVIILICILASLAKLGIIILLIGVLFIYRRYLKLLKYLAVGVFLFTLLSYVVLRVTNLEYFIARFTTDSGHYDLIIKTLAQLESINLFIGAGIGSIPAFTTNKLILSRIYEGGVIGILFVLQISWLPFKVLFQKTINSENIILKDVCIGLIFSTVLGLHLYDYFIYPWFWIIVGAIMSYYNNTKQQALN